MAKENERSLQKKPETARYLVRSILRDSSIKDDLLRVCRASLADAGVDRRKAPKFVEAIRKLQEMTSGKAGDLMLMLKNAGGNYEMLYLIRLGKKPLVPAFDVDEGEYWIEIGNRGTRLDFSPVTRYWADSGLVYDQRREIRVRRTNGRPSIEPYWVFLSDRTLRTLNDDELSSVTIAVGEDEIANLVNSLEGRGIHPVGSRIRGPLFIAADLLGVNKKTVGKITGLTPADQEIVRNYTRKNRWLSPKKGVAFN